MQYSPTPFYIQIYSIAGGFYTSHRYRRREDAPLGVSSKGGTPFFEGSSFQEIGRASADSSTWVFIAGSWPLHLVHFGGVSCAI
jgi:hypothetical protein